MSSRWVKVSDLDAHEPQPVDHKARDKVARLVAENEGLQRQLDEQARRAIEGGDDLFDWVVHDSGVLEDRTTGRRWRRVYDWREVKPIPSIVVRGHPWLMWAVGIITGAGGVIAGRMVGLW